MGLSTKGLGNRESYEPEEAQMSAERKYLSSSNRFAERQAPKDPCQFNISVSLRRQDCSYEGKKGSYTVSSECNPFYATPFC